MDELVRRLIDLQAASILIRAATAGTITTLECAMPQCACPNGRGYFEQSRGRASAWSPTPDRHPVPARDGGAYAVHNVRLAHNSCNKLEGSRVGSERLSEWHKSHPGHARTNGLRAAAWRRAHPVAHAAQTQALLDWAKSHPEHASAAGRRSAAWKRAHPTEASAQGTALAAWFEAHPAARAASGRKRSCGHWNIARGKPCTCGQHPASLMAPSISSPAG